MILYPGLDFQHIDALQEKTVPGQAGERNKAVIVWNHRWEHDKDPETFFHTLFELAEEYSFQLIVLGQHFRHRPDIFSQAETVLADRLLHFGYAESREQYAGLLTTGDYIVSTARHEFFGMSVLEGVRAGCRPVVPDRLSYQELFPEEYRYAEGELKKHLRQLFTAPRPMTYTKARSLTEAYSWSALGKKYQDWLRFPQ
ncbi:MAG: glycosyltransferase family 1 protein [Candidatus Electrothrix sp. EH2]|nr:glycosyltransferase family 1 protein [Candidatus Electrothrix sp. EH2]